MADSIKADADVQKGDGERKNLNARVEDGEDEDETTPKEEIPSFKGNESTAPSNDSSRKPYDGPPRAGPRWVNHMAQAGLVRGYIKPRLCVEDGDSFVVVTFMNDLTDEVKLSLQSDLKSRIDGGVSFESIETELNTYQGYTVSVERVQADH